MEGIDLYHELPILNTQETPGGKTEQRGALILHQKLNVAYRLLASVQQGHHWAVCYRIQNIQEPVQLDLDNTSKKFFPTEAFIDLSIADGTVGVHNMNVRSFCVNSEHTSDRVLIRFLVFLLESDIVMHDDNKMFDDLSLSERSLVPYPGDPHHKLIYSIPED
jgi:hypothetical protein